MKALQARMAKKPPKETTTELLLALKDAIETDSVAKVGRMKLRGQARFSSLRFLVPSFSDPRVVHEAKGGRPEG